MITPASNSYLYSLFSYNPYSQNMPPSYSLSGIAQQAYLMNIANRKLPNQAISALTTLKQYSDDLLNFSKQLQLSTYNNAFKQVTTTSSNPVAVTTQAQPGATLASYNVSVTQLAAAQQNTGTAMTSNYASTLAPGAYSFNITMNGVVKAVTFNVASGDTDQTVLSNMSKAINLAGAGVTATVKNNTVSGTSQLVIQSNNTGTNNAFTVTDKVGTAASYTGAGIVSVSAANASYSINSVGYTSYSNTIYTDNNKVKLTLSGIASNVKVTVAQDTQTAASSVNNFVNSYNKLLTYVGQNSQFINPSIISTLNQNVNYQAANLKSIGICINPDKTLRVDQTALNNTLEKNPALVQSTFSGYNGMAVNAGHVAQRISFAPLSSFLQPQLFAEYNYTGIYSNLAMMNKLSLWNRLLRPGSLYNLLI